MSCWATNLSDGCRPSALWSLLAYIRIGITSGCVLIKREERSKKWGRKDTVHPDRRPTTIPCRMYGLVKLWHVYSEQLPKQYNTLFGKKEEVNSLIQQQKIHINLIFLQSHHANLFNLFWMTCTSQLRRIYSLPLVTDPLHETHMRVLYIVRISHCQMLAWLFAQGSSHLKALGCFQK